LRLLDQLSTTPEIRSSLVNMRAEMLGEANAILPPGGAAPAGAMEVPVSPTILNEALERVKTTYPSLPKTASIPDGITTVDAAAQWLASQPGVPSAAAGEYRKAVIAALRAHAEAISQDLVKPGLQIFPSPYPGVLKFQGRRNVLGIFLAGLFLSLGAPFWYNALANLSNLRTVVAAKEQKESAAA
jgi:hypothetical protein